ncbi:MAG: hypothetical protein AB7P03_19920 [Kofleriaceae bacterium]
MNRKTLVLAVMFGLATAFGCMGAGNGQLQIVHDPFLGRRQGFILYLDPGGFTAVGVNEAQGKYTMEVLVVERGMSGAIAPIGSTAQFVVGNKILTLASALEAKPITNATPSTVITQWKLTFLLDRAQASRFAIGPMTAIKTMVGNQEYQLEITPRDAQQIQHNLQVMTSSASAPPSDNG